MSDKTVYLPLNAFDFIDVQVVDSENWRCDGDDGYDSAAVKADGVRFGEMIRTESHGVFYDGLVSTLVAEDSSIVVLDDTYPFGDKPKTVLLKLTFENTGELDRLDQRALNDVFDDMGIVLTKDVTIEARSYYTDDDLKPEMDELARAEQERQRVCPGEGSRGDGYDYCSCLFSCLCGKDYPNASWHIWDTSRVHCCDDIDIRCKTCGEAPGEGDNDELLHRCPPGFFSNVPPAAADGDNATDFCLAQNTSCDICFPALTPAVREVLRNVQFMHGIGVGLESEKRGEMTPFSQLKRKPLPEDIPDESPDMQETMSQVFDGRDNANEFSKETILAYSIRKPWWAADPQTQPFKLHSASAGPRAFVRCCGDVIQSTHLHDFVICRCGDSSIDGGSTYTRGGGQNLRDIVLLED